MNREVLLHKDSVIRTNFLCKKVCENRNMFTVQFGIFYIFVLCCCQRTQAKGLLVFNNRTSVALANETLHFYIRVTVPANSSKTTLSCFRNSQKIWTHNFLLTYPADTILHQWANITMHNSSDSGVYFFQYQTEKKYWVALVRDVGYSPPDEALESHAIALLVVTLILLLFSIMGSGYMFKWYKDHRQPEKVGDEMEARKSERNVVVTTQGKNSESVYTALEPRPVSIYDVLKVDQARRESTEKQTSKEMAKTSQVEEGIFESVYENL